MSASIDTQFAKASEEGAHAVLARKVFSFPAFLGVLLLAGTFMVLFANMETVTSDPSSASEFWLQGDTWWHLAIGRQILTAHSWPRVDIYSFTMRGAPWTAYEWLGEVVMAAAWRIGGLQALMVLLTALAGAVVLLLFYYSYLRSRNATAAFLACAALLPLASLSFTMRPQIFGYVFLVMTLISLERFRQGHPKALWALPVIFLLWVNAHGTFALGFAILAIYFVSGFFSFHVRGLRAERWTPGQRRQLGITILLCAVASVLTPYGAQLVAYYVELKCLAPVNLKVVTEWQPFQLFNLSGVIFIASVLIFCFALLTSRLSCRLPDFALLVIATTETLLHSRFILLFVPVFAPFLAEIFAGWVPKRQAARNYIIGNAVLMACIGLGIIKFFPSKARLEEAVKLTAPVEAADFVRSHPRLGNTFTYYDWGSYLIFDLGSAHKVFMDGRLDLYESGGVFQDYLTVLWTQPEAMAVLRKYNIRSCLILRGSTLGTLLAASPDWKQVYHDNLSVLFVRNSANPLSQRAAASVGTNSL